MCWFPSFHCTPWLRHLISTAAHPPAARGQNDAEHALTLLDEALAHIAGELRAEGFCRAWIGTDFDNAASQNGIALAGFRHVADLVVDRVVAMRLVWVRGRDGAPEHVVTDVRRALLGDRDRAWLSALPLAKHDQPMMDA